MALEDSDTARAHRELCQIVVAREIHRKGVYPPINILPSLSRLMNAGIGKDSTRKDHKGVSDQCYAGYAEGKDLRGLVAIVGKEALSERDVKFLGHAIRSRSHVNPYRCHGVVHVDGRPSSGKLPRESLSVAGLWEARCR